MSKLKILGLVLAMLALPAVAVAAGCHCGEDCPCKPTCDCDH